MKKLKVLLIHDGEDPMPQERDFGALKQSSQWGTEIAAYQALKARGHTIESIGFNDDPLTLLDKIRLTKPDVVFNLAESCLGEYRHDHNIPSLLELARVPYTGCGPIGLMLCNNKALTKKVLTYHQIKVPQFCVYRIGETVRFPAADFTAPYFVKPLQEEASEGISQRSLAKTEEQCQSRVAFVHESLKKDAMIEQYIAGRELYVGLFGNGKNIKVLPPWELKFANAEADEPKIATYRAKWSETYRKKWGIINESAGPLSEGVLENIQTICKKAYRVLNLDGYARFDIRLTKDGEVYIIEANANPELARGEDFAASAEKDGIPYEQLIEKLLQLAVQR
jgi:D-alanine-D-alanine ligase